MTFRIFSFFAFFLTFVSVNNSWALTQGAISGTITDPQGIAMPNTPVKIYTDGKLVKETSTSTTGDFQFFGVEFGNYDLVVETSGFVPYHNMIHVGSGAATLADVHLEAKNGNEMVLKVEAKRQMINQSSSTSNQEISHEQIEQLPEGSDISLPRLLETTDPGVVQGPFNQTFIRGNHANVQYQIDGVQLPDSVSGTFAEAFSTRNIDHMEVITGGMPAEYGERLAAVMNIVTKTGAEAPNGSAELNYGSYNTFNPQAMYGGSNAAGDWHYFISGSYNNTQRGLDTPQPSGTAFSQQSQGGTDAVHDDSNGNNQFIKVDWLPNNEDKISFIAFQNYNFYQIPNFPSSFSSSDPYFGAGYTDFFQNNNGTAPVFNYAPANTNDTQSNQDAYAQVVWKHTFSDHSFLQVAPYWKYSKVRVDNDAANDLAEALNPTYFIPNSSPDSFSLDHHVNNVGVKADYEIRPDDRNLIKVGTQLQASQGNDTYTVLGVTAGATYDPTLQPTPYSDGGVDRGYSEDVYAQDDFTINKQWSLNVGLRFSAYQFYFPDDNDKSTDDQFQPRVGLNYMATDTTKLHAYYGRLFMPAPLEDLRAAFNQFAPAGTPLATFYDIRAEKDNYFEFGVDQQFAQQQLATLNLYYKAATDMLDDTQLLNTAIAAPYNYANGYAYGVEFSVKGKITPELSEYFNYAYEIAKGENISGGSIGVTQPPPADTYIYLDHVQVHTANTGLTYAKDNYFGTVEGLFGSGLRTGPDNDLSLPSHFTFDLTAGYRFHGDSWLTNWKVQGDVLNIFNNVYPITIDNGFNGSHYAAGREFFIRLTKEL